MNPNPRILLTNDDGIDAPGLQHLKTIAARISNDVWTVAPDSNQSGAGHRFTLGHELEAEKRDERTFAVSGTPADCTVVGCTHFAAEKPVEIVLSGINNGQNQGDIMHASGTAAGAREGAFQGAISIALSQAINYEKTEAVNWENAIAYGESVIRTLLSLPRNRDVYYNVNFPFCAPDKVSGVTITAPQRFSRSAFRYYPSRNEGKFFVTIPDTPEPNTQGHDVYELQTNNAITVTPVSLLQAHVEEMDRLKALEFKLR